MARDGSGTYTLPTAAFVFDTVISATNVNSNFSDITDELTASLSKDGQTTATANLPMATFKHTGVDVATMGDEYVDVGSFQGGSFVWCGTATGTANAIVLTPSPGIAAYAAGQRFLFLASAANTSTVTVAVSGLAAKALNKDGGTGLSAEDIISSGALVEIVYDGTDFEVLTPIPAAASAGSYQVGAFSRNITTASGTTSQTSVGFQPTLIIFLVGKSTSDSALSFGFDDGTAAHCSFYGGLTSNGANTSTTYSIRINDSTTEFQTAVVQSMDADGFTLDWTKTGSPASEVFQIKYLAIG